MSGAGDAEVRQDITDVVFRYATGIDRRDWAALRSCFTDDCESDYGETGAWHSADDITAWMREVHEACGHTMHSISNVVIETKGDAATARSYVNAIVLGPDNEHGARAAGYYDDEFVKTADGWKIARRRFTTVLLQSIPEGLSLSFEP